MAKRSNDKRWRMRKECREALAAHIYERLGLRIAPEDVRLQPQPKDGYSWAVMESRATLLKSSLSSGTLGLYQSTCSELGHTLEAVPPRELEKSHSGSMILDNENDSMSSCISFTARIRLLETANEEQQVHLNRTSAQLHKSLCDGKAPRSEVSNLRQEMEAIVLENNSFRDEVIRSRSGIAKVMTILNGMTIHHGDTLVDSSDTEVKDSVKST